MEQSDGQSVGDSLVWLALAMVAGPMVCMLLVGLAMAVSLFHIF